MYISGGGNFVSERLSLTVDLDVIYCFRDGGVVSCVNLRLFRKKEDISTQQDVECCSLCAQSKANSSLYI